MSTKLDIIKKYVEEAGFTLTDEQADQLMKFYEMLIEKNKVMNLTAVTEFEEVVKKHFADSLTLCRAIDVSSVGSMIDVGTGAGFPGIPLAICYPNVKICLMDSLRKRIDFLEEVKNALGLHNIITVHARAEELARNKDYREKFDLSVSRAVANLATLSEYTLPFVKVGGNFISYKSVKTDEEVNDAGKALHVLGGKLDRIEKFELFEMERSLVVIKKVQKTSKVYPRKAGTPSKNPIK